MSRLSKIFNVVVWEVSKLPSNQKRSQYHLKGLVTQLVTFAAVSQNLLGGVQQSQTTQGLLNHLRDLNTGEGQASIHKKENPYST